MVLCNATGCPALETATEMLSALIPGLGDSLEAVLLERDAVVRLKADLVGGTVTLFRGWPETYRMEDVHWSHSGGHSPSSRRARATNRVSPLRDASRGSMSR